MKSFHAEMVVASHGGEHLHTELSVVIDGGAHAKSIQVD